MSDPPIPTNAASSGVHLDRKVLKAMAKRSDRPGIQYLIQWGIALLVSGYLVWLSLGTGWIWLAQILYGTILVVPVYALSHETAHGTAFKTRWLNDAVYWITSLIYLEEPLHRRYTHTQHHTYTWHTEKDAQIAAHLTMDFPGWMKEILGYSLFKFHLISLWSLATGRYTKMVLECVPESELPKLTRNARLFVLIYCLIATLIAFGHMWLIWFLVLPRILGGVSMLLFTVIQHVEMQENSPSILETTRSFKTVWPASFLYMNMEHHIEHHLYPQIPFYSLPQLNQALADQLPEPDPGLIRTNLELLSVAIRRSLGRNTKAKSIRQAPSKFSDKAALEFSQTTG